MAISNPRAALGTTNNIAPFTSRLREIYKVIYHLFFFTLADKYIDVWGTLGANPPERMRQSCQFRGSEPQ